MDTLSLNQSPSLRETAGIFQGSKLCCQMQSEQNSLKQWSGFWLLRRDTYPSVLRRQAVTSFNDTLLGKHTQVETHSSCPVWAGPRTVLQHVALRLLFCHSAGRSALFQRNCANSSAMIDDWSAIFLQAEKYIPNRDRKCKKCRLDWQLLH